MERRGNVVSLLIGVVFCVLCGNPVLASELQQEYVTTTPVLADGILYVASSTIPGHRGHLRAIDIVEPFPVTLWDAAERMPLAGTGTTPGGLTSSDPPTESHPENLFRSIFTILGSE